MAPSPSSPPPRKVVAQLLDVEELCRQRAPGERTRAIASQRTGRIDPNPHQIDAVVFALARLDEGGCILADEVGLGKTIEAGLVLAQRLSEGATRALLIVPKPLIGQWRDELRTLFEIEAREVRVESGAFGGEGVFLVGREAAGGKVLAGLLARAPAFDLCIIDEAHEIFGGLHRRYDRAGNYRDDTKMAQIAGRVKEALGETTPTLLLTATPLQNSLSELWSLVQYVDPSGTLLGDLPTFRARFAAADDRQVDPAQADELRSRLGRVVQRTLRRQAQPTIDKPFVGRRARVFEFSMSPDERALYDDVTRYLLRPNLAAFRGSHRTLLLLGFHRRMASSKAALAASLRNVQARLERQLRGSRDDGEATADALLRDLDDDGELAELLAGEDREDPDASTELDVAGELEHVRELAARAERLTTDSKAQALLRAVRLLRDAGVRGEGSGKAVIFTESRTTQAYLRDLLVEAGVCAPGQVTCFNGSNDDSRAREALVRWEREIEAVSSRDEDRLSRSIATRMALVHEFRTRSDVFIGTEAAAKGLNLQFCDALINYDLPWNPQRIEQRIGRVHRYGQERDVTVVNFLGRDNEAQRLTFDILARKLELFGQVLGASDEVLGASVGHGRELARLDDDERVALSSALAADFERQLGEVYRKAQTVEEIEAGLARLGGETAARRDELLSARARTRSLIAERLDEAVQRVFRDIAAELPKELELLDEALTRVVRRTLAWGLGGAGEAHASLREQRVERARAGGDLLHGTRFELVRPDPSAGGGETSTRVFYVGDARALPDAEVDAVERLHPGHPLVRKARSEARDAAREIGGPLVLTADATLPAGVGRLSLELARYGGFLPSERLLCVAAMRPDVGAGGAPVASLGPPALHTLLAQLGAGDERCGASAPRVAAPAPAPDPRLIAGVLEDAREEARFVAQGEVAAEGQARFDRAMERLETFVRDRRGVLSSQRRALLPQLAKAETARDEAVAGKVRANAEARVRHLAEQIEALEEGIAALDARALPRYQELRASAHERLGVAPVYEPLLTIDFVVRAAPRGGESAGEGSDASVREAGVRESGVREAGVREASGR